MVNFQLDWSYPPEIGASVYVGLKEYPLSKNLEYLDLLKSIGIEKVFISAHIPEMNEGFKEELKEVVDYANKLSLKIILDVSKPMLRDFEIPNIYSLRFDWGFSDDDIIEIYKNNKFKIELNASTISASKLEYLRANGVDLGSVRVSHNFYPKPETGLSFNKVLEINNMLRSYGLKVMGYIQSNHGKRPPLYLGLPTVESHRNARLEVALQEMKLLGFSEVIFGDAYASKEELYKAKNFDYSIWQLPLKLNDDVTEVELNQIKKIHRSRLDASSAFIRSSVRIKDNIIEPKNTIERNEFAVTVDNLGYGRYMGEVAVILKDLDANESVNVVGKVDASREILEGIKPGDKYKFIDGE